jgi:hypothetical protein
MVVCTPCRAPSVFPVQSATRLEAVFSEPEYPSTGALDLKLEPEADVNKHRLGVGAAGVSRLG